MLLTIYDITQKTMSPQKSVEDIMINFVRSSNLQMFFKIDDACKNFLNFTGKNCVGQSLLNKAAGLKVCNFIKKRLPSRGVFLQNFTNF